MADVANYSIGPSAPVRPTLTDGALAVRSTSYTRIPSTAPSTGPVQYSQCTTQMPPTIDGPSDRAGLKDPPVNGPVTSAPAKIVAPIANRATAGEVCESAATAMMTKRAYVMRGHTGATVGLPPVRR